MTAKTYPELPEDGDPDGAGEEELPDSAFMSPEDAAKNDTVDIEEDDE